MLELKRTLVMLLLAALMVGMFAGCSDSDAEPSKNASEYPYPELVGSTLNVYNWGDYIDPDVIGIFEKETGIKVVYDTFDFNESMYTKVKNSNASYDVVIPSDYMIKRMIDEDMLAKIDMSQLENYSKIGDNYKSREYDPNNEYSVAYMWGTLGILYNTTMVDEPVDSWEVYWSGKYDNNSFLMDSVRDTIGMTLKYLGYSLNSTSKEELDEAEAKLAEAASRTLGFTGDDVKDKMIAGEAAIAMVYSGDAVTCMDPEEGNPDLAYALPKEGTNLWFDAMCILKDAPNYDAAVKFIDFMCRTDIAAKNRDYINYSTPQTEVYEALDDEIKNDPAQYPPQEVMDKGEVFVDLGESISYYDHIWTKIING